MMHCGGGEGCWEAPWRGELYNWRCRDGEMRDKGRELLKPREVAGANVAGEGKGERQMSFRTEVMKNG